MRFTQTSEFCTVPVNFVKAEQIPVDPDTKDSLHGTRSLRTQLSRSKVRTPQTGPNSVRPLLKGTYYLDNFNFVINFVSDHYRKLLLDEEQQFLQSYKTLSDDAQQLFVRLALRSSAFLRLSKISYAEFEVAPALKKLGKAGFVNLDIDSIDHCLPLFTRPELSAALGIHTNKVPPIDSPYWTTDDLFGDSPIVKLFINDSVIEVNYKLIVRTFRLLFFGNLHQDFSSFVLRDLGYQRFESYKIDSQNLLFNTREQIEAHLAYYQCIENFDAACKPTCEPGREPTREHAGNEPSSTDALIELHNALPLRIENDKLLCRRLDRLNNNIARQLERQSALASAADIYGKSSQPPARERLARIHAKTGNPAQALELCRQIVQSPSDSDELDFACSFGQRLAKKTDQPFPTDAKYKPPEATLTLPASNLSVEHSVATHLAKSGKCYYLENNLISGIFGLAFWDIIFAPVNGVFFHPFQRKPADFYEPGFLSARQSLINTRITEISSGRLSSIVNKHMYHKRGIQNPMVKWRMCRKHIIDLAIRRIPALTWSQLFNQMLTDIRNYRAGQPDLIFFPDDGGYQFVEVKAPGDKLQKNQLRWMKFFDQQDIPHTIVNVEWSESIHDDS